MSATGNAWRASQSVALITIETMGGPEILSSVDQIEKLDKVARRTFGISDVKDDPTQWAVNIAIVGTPPSEVS